MPVEGFGAVAGFGLRVDARDGRCFLWRARVAVREVLRDFAADFAFAFGRWAAVGAGGVVIAGVVAAGAA